MTTDGMLVRLEAVRDGSHPDMPVVDVLTADGETVQFEVSRRGIQGDRYGIGWPVGRRDDGALLIEFSTQYGCLSGGKHFGSHRIYVPADSLVRAGSAGEREL